jgi:hypothetical protein
MLKISRSSLHVACSQAAVLLTLGAGVGLVACSTDPAGPAGAGSDASLGGAAGAGGSAAGGKGGTAGTGGKAATGGTAGTGGKAGTGGAGTGGTAGTGGAGTGGAGTGGTVGTGGKAGTGGAVSDSGTPPADAAPDAPVSTVPSCGATPRQHFTLGATPIAGGANLTSDATVYASLTNNLSLCSGTKVIIPAPFTAKGPLEVQGGVPFFFAATQAESVPSLSGEYNINPAIVGRLPDLPYTAALYGSAVPATMMPSFIPATSAFLVVVMGKKSGGTAPCDDTGGVVFTIAGHTIATDLVIKYQANGVTSTGSPSTAGGQLWNTMTLVTTGTVAAPEFVTVVGTKAGCTVGLDSQSALFYSGRVPVAKGAASITTLEVRN